MVFPVFMYGCESWTVKKAESWRIDAFELWCWRRPLRVPWTARRSNQSILKEIIPGISLEGMMLKLKLQYFGHLMRKVDSLEKTLMLGGVGGRTRRGRQRMRWLDGITDSMGMSLGELRSWWWTGRPGVLRFMGSQSQTRLSDWTGLNWHMKKEWTAICYGKAGEKKETSLRTSLRSCRGISSALFLFLKTCASSPWLLWGFPSSHIVLDVYLQCTEFSHKIFSQEKLYNNGKTDENKIY